MKARVKSTGEIVEVDFHMETKRGKMFGEVTDSRRLCKPDSTFRKFYQDEIEFLSYEDTEVIDYWTRLEHQYAGMVMHSILQTMPRVSDPDKYMKAAIDLSAKIATALVEKLKSE